MHAYNTQQTRASFFSGPLVWAKGVSSGFWSVYGIPGWADELGWELLDQDSSVFAKSTFLSDSSPGSLQSETIIESMSDGRLPRCDFLLCSERGERRGHLEEQ